MIERVLARMICCKTAVIRRMPVLRGNNNWEQVLPYLHGHRSFRRKMHIVTLHPLQALTPDGIYESCRSAMIQIFRRRLRLVFELHFERMSLACADTQAVFA